MAPSSAFAGSRLLRPLLMKPANHYASGRSPISVVIEDE